MNSISRIFWYTIGTELVLHIPIGGVGFDLGRLKMATKKLKKTNGKTVNGSRRSPTPVAAEEHSGPRWTFLTNHAHVLTVLDSDPNLTLREVALRVGITERAVQRIVLELEQSGFLERQKIGRQNQYKVLKHQPLRHPIEAHRSIGDLLSMITG